MSTAPSTFLLSFGVTEINRQTIWDSLTDADRGKYATTTSSTSTTGSTTTTSTSGSTTTAGSTTTTAPTTAASGFVSRGTTSQLSSAAFAGLYDSTYSSSPTSATQTGYGKLWATSEDLQKQLTGANGGAIFVDVKAGSLANGLRPDDGSKGFNPDNPRGFNPYGYIDQDTSKFVQLRQGGDVNGKPSFQAISYDDATSQLSQATKYWDPSSGTWATSAATTSPAGMSRATWEATSHTRYGQYQGLVAEQMSKVTGMFGSQGLLGFDVNNNGRIDNESELFGFDAGLKLTGSAAVSDAASTDGTGTKDFTFLANDGRLTGDPLDPNQTSSLSDYRRFMVLKSDGSSQSVLQSEIGYNMPTGQYIKAQSYIQFDTTAHTATLSVVAQNGMSVSQVA